MSSSIFINPVHSIFYFYLWCEMLYPNPITNSSANSFAHAAPADAAPADAAPGDAEFGH